MREQRDVHAGMLDDKARDDLRQQFERHGGRARDGQRAAPHRTDLLCCQRDAVQPDERAFHFVVQHAGFGGRHEPALLTLEQHEADAGLEVG
jgi:hypothetical protein